MGKLNRVYPLPTLDLKYNLIIDLMEKQGLAIIESYTSKTWEAAKRRAQRIVAQKGNENRYCRIYDDDDHSRVVFVTPERAKRIRGKYAGN